MYDRYEDLAASLDRQLLMRPEPPAHADAQRQLEKAKLPVGRVVNVYPDCVLYVDPDGVAMTAWARKQATGVFTYVAECGFQAFPNPFLGDKPE